MNSSESVKPIGGYFEWEFPTQKEFSLHENAIFLNSGRHALEYILRGIGNVSRLYIPYYTCDAVLFPLSRLNIPHTFYCIDENFDIVENIHLRDNEYLLYTNYFGIKDKFVEQVTEQYGERVIIDNAQSLYCQTYAKHQIYSPRKYLGMPDGGLAVTTVPDFSSDLPVGLAYDRCDHLLKRSELSPSDGYNDFKIVSHQIANSSLSRMSNISYKILKSVDLNSIKETRRRNFLHLHEALGKLNKLNIPSMDEYACPMVYPFWTDDKKLKEKLIKEQVFVATYWPNVLEWTKSDMLEYEFANNLLAIPLDQRYNEEDMIRIIKLIWK